MVSINVTGICKGCPFLNLEMIYDMKTKNAVGVMCRHEPYCDRGEKKVEKDD